MTFYFKKFTLFEFTDDYFTFFKTYKPLPKKICNIMMQAILN